jgi:hypothetical protein
MQGFSLSLSPNSKALLLLLGKREILIWTSFAFQSTSLINH